jgi:hypothetical protein
MTVKITEDKAAISSLNSTVFSLQEQLATSQIKLESSTATFLAQKEKLTAQRDEFETRAIRLQSRDDQYQALIKRKEIEFERLKKAVQERNSGSTRPSATSSKSSSGTTLNAKLGFKGNEEGFYTSLVTSLEFRQAELLEENSELRSNLHDMHQNLESVVEKHEVLSEYIIQLRKADADLKALKPVDRLDVPESQFAMPMDYITSNISSTMFEQLNSLKARIDAIVLSNEKSSLVGTANAAVAGGDKVAELNTVVAGLEGKVLKLQKIIKQQDDLIQAAIFSERTAAAATSDIDVETKLELEEQRLRAREEREELDREWDELKSLKMGEFFESSSAGTLFINTPDRMVGGGKGVNRRNSLTGTPGSVARLRKSGSVPGSPMIDIPFDATPATRMLLERIGIRTGVEVKKVVISNDELFG